jgi:hypothetical protein
VAGIGAQTASNRLAFDKSRVIETGSAGDAPKKPMPPAALKMQNESLDAIGTASGLNADLGAMRAQIEKGDLKFGPVANLMNRGLNASGASTQESRNFASAKANLERLRNESLRLNTGTQTEGDAQRAWNELFENTNDTKVVSQRLQEIGALNDRAVDLHQLRLDGVRANYGYEPMDTTAQRALKPALNGGKSNAAKPSGADQIPTGASVRNPAGPARNPSPAGITVTDPNGGVHTFPNAAAANAFKKSAGL